MKAPLIGVGLTGLVGLVIALTPTTSISQSPPSTDFVPPASTPASPDSPRRFTIQVSVVQPEDLKVTEGQEVQAGDLIADRGRERVRLEAQQQQLELTLHRLQTATITPPLPPAAVPALAALPPVSYLEQEAAIAQAKAEVDQAEAAIALKQQEMEYLSSLENLDPLVMEHEQAQLADLKRQHTEAVRGYQLAMGKLETAQQQQDYQTYQHSIDLAQRVESENQAALDYQQQLSAYEQRLRDREYQVSQVQLKWDEVNDAIATLAVIRAPYDGTVRRVRWLGQGPDGSLSAEVILLLSSAGDPSTLSGQ